MKKTYFGIIALMFFALFLVIHVEKTEKELESEKCTHTVVCIRKQKVCLQSRETRAEEREKKSLSLKREKEDENFFQGQNLIFDFTSDNKEYFSSSHSRNPIIKKLKFRPQTARMYIKSEEPGQKNS